MDFSVNDTGDYLFGPFQLDPARRMLRCNGVPIKLAPRLFETLLYLVRNAGRVVDKDELMAAIWGGRIVEETNLSQAIFSLRKTLQAEAGEDGYIVTAPGRGYYFAAPVQLRIAASPAVMSDAATPAAPAPQAAPPLPHRHFAASTRLRFAGVVVAGCLAAGLGAAVLWRVLAPSVESPAAFAPPPHSVAVLAFDNLSGDPKQDYLADGLSEELINVLTRVDALHVAARTSAFMFKSQPATVSDIARKLNVGAVLEGSVRRDGQRLRVTAQLVNASTGYNFWSHSYDRDFNDILHVQTEIAEDVAVSLEVTLQAGDKSLLTMAGTDNAAAFDAFLQGMRSMHGRDDASFRAALSAFDEAVRLDPNFAAAHAKRAFVLMSLASFEATSDVARVRAELAQAMESANKAIELAPGWAGGYATRGAIYLGMLDLGGAERELAHARSLAPGDTGVDATLAFVEAYLGYRAAAEAAAARVVAAYPLDTYVYADQATILFLGREYAGALAALRHARALGGHLSPQDELTSAFIAIAQGKPEVARQQCSTGPRSQQDHGYQQDLCLAIAQAALGNRPDAAAHLAKARAQLGDNGAYQYVQVYAQWGDKAQALDWLETAYKLRDTGLVMLRTDPMLDPIRGESGFRDVEQKLNFPP